MGVTRMGTCGKCAYVIEDNGELVCNHPRKWFSKTRKAATGKMVSPHFGCGLWEPRKPPSLA